MAPPSAVDATAGAAPTEPTTTNLVGELADARQRQYEGKASPIEVHEEPSGLTATPV